MREMTEPLFGVCPECKVRDRNSSEKELHKCSYCGREFCEKYLRPRLAFIRDLTRDVKPVEFRRAIITTILIVILLSPFLQTPLIKGKPQETLTEHMFVEGELSIPDSVVTAFNMSPVQFGLLVSQEFTIQFSAKKFLRDLDGKMLMKILLPTKLTYITGNLTWEGTERERTLEARVKAKIEGDFLVNATASNTDNGFAIVLSILARVRSTSDELGALFESTLGAVEEVGPVHMITDANLLESPSEVPADHAHIHGIVYTYSYSNGRSYMLRGTQLELWEDIALWPDDHIATVYTVEPTIDDDYGLTHRNYVSGGVWYHVDDSGSFDFGNVYVGAGKNLYINMFFRFHDEGDGVSSGGTEKLKITNTDVIGVRYNIGTYSSGQDSGVLGLTVASLDAGNSLLQDESAHIFYDIVKTYGYFENLVGFEPGLVTARIDYSSTSPPASAGHTIYFNGWTNDYLAYEITDSIVHEYSHSTHWYMRGGSFPPLAPGDTNHGGHANSDSADALTEGWARFVPTIINKDPIYHWGSATGTWDIRPDWRCPVCGQCDRDEWVFGSILWDIKDMFAPHSGFFSISYTLDAHDPNFVRTFFDNFISDWDQRQSVWQVFYNHGVNYDTAAPITTIEHSPGSSILSLSAYDETSGVAVTYYRIDGGAWNTYTGPITLTGTGSHTIDYYSEDNAGNPEPTKSLTVHYLTVSTDPAGITSIDGEGWYDAGTTATAGTAPSIVSGGTGEQYVFIEWRVDGTPVSGNPINVFMDSPHTATATYKTQLLLTIRTSGLPSPSYPTNVYLDGSQVGTAYDNEALTKWFDAGEPTGIIGVDGTVSGATGTQYLFIRWEEDSSTDNPRPSVAMDAPVTYIAVYKTQYQISFTTYGLPDGVEVTVTVNGVDHPITTPSSYQEWFDEDTSVSFDINPKSLTVGGIEYTFDRWIRESDGQTITSPQTVTEPDKFKAIYKPVTYDVTIKAYCTTEGTDVSVSFTWDGTTYATSKIFTDQTGSHIVVVAEGDPNGHPFVKWVKDDTDYSTNREITVSSGGLYTAIYAAVPTNNPPTIPTVISPNGGEIWSGTHDITWTTSTDPDDDPITYEIEYSYDGGNTWHDLASGISGTSYPWDTTTCPDSANYLIRVRAYDGELYSGNWDASDSIFTIENRAPTIIDHAPTGTQVPVTTIISVTFSEAMNQTSSENAFSISPMVSGSFTWSDDTMIFTPSLGLEYDTTYDVTITTEAEDLVGNNLQSPFNWQFTTSVAPPPPSPPPARPSPPPRIDVNVQTLDWEGEVLSNAYVEIVGRVTSGLSDSNGWVNFTDIEAGTLTFDVYWMGAKVNKTTTTLKVDSTITLRCHVWNLQLLTQDVNNNSLASTTIYTTFPNGTTKPLSTSTYRVMNGTYWFIVKWQNNWVYGNSSINLDVTTTSYTINCKVYQLSLSWRDHDGTWPFNPTSYKIIAPNGTISSVTTPIINQAQNGTWEIHAVYWQENNVVPSTHPTHELASNYNWTIHSRIYQIAIGFKDADGNVISTPSTYTITFPNQTSKSLGTFAFRCQNGTILITAITWQASEVCPSSNPTISITASQTYYVNLEVFNPTLNVLKPDGTTAFANTKLDIRFPNGTIIKNIQTDVNGQIILKVQKGTCYINVTTTDGYLAQVNHEVSISTTQTFDIPTIGLYAEVPVNEQIYPMLIKTNSTEVSNFVFDAEKREINFNVSGIPGTVGTCIINILKELVDSRSDIKVYIDGKKTEFTLTEDANNYYIYVEYQHSTRVIKISFAHSILEALLQVIIESGWLILLATVIVTVVALFSIFARKKRISKIKQ